MAYIKTKEGANTSTNQKEYYVDAISDLDAILVTNRRMGDYAYILDGTNKGEIYMVNGSLEWVLQ